ncbi:virulence factor BrkB family protein [Wenzhouxiangella sp. XN201]|uniref:virulence factor BrkB family protein n=1 Tax=Wenzhouxiangella sp. XN201 TaxID=2710755 RepID=UPI0013DB278F|nr:virulence factor BrkB family protein [Wenzhouxiangella sp. XN201]
MNRSESSSEKKSSLPTSGVVSKAGRTSWLQARYDVGWVQAFNTHLWRHFREDRSFEAAAALSYTSLLALVPLMAVMLGVISAFPVFDQWAADVESYIFSNFVPTAGDAIQQHLNEFVERTAGLTGAGTVFLIVTAILLMSTIERSFNRIWRVAKPRGITGRLLTYWSVLTLGPLLMGGSLALTSYLAAVPQLAPEAVRSVLQAFILNLTPFFVSLIGFALVFLVVPNRKVRLRHALVGAFISAVLFELAKRGFVLYVTHFPTYERLYGALATVPIFLVWIYLSWVVVLLGASVAAALTTFNYRKSDWRWSRRHELVLALRLLGHFWHTQRQGRALSQPELLSREPAASDAQIGCILDWFHQAGFIQPDEDGDWLLSTDLDDISLGELYRAGPFILPIGELDSVPVDSHWDRALISSLKPVDESGRPALNRSIKSLLKFQVGEAS